MKKQVRKDKINRNLLFLNEIKRFLLKNIVKNNNISIYIRWKAELTIANMPKGGSSTVYCNRCIITGRRKRINKFYSFSRIMFLRLARFGYLCSLKKSSW
jgi:small subunit ribosomal protein S14